MDETMDAGAKDFYDSYRNRGFYFSSSVLSRYALSLHSKPFVILSGVSGTGKTKIAQLFDPVAPAAAEATVDEAAAGAAIERIVFTATAGMRTGDGRGNLANEHMGVVFEPNDLAHIDKRSADLIAKGALDNVIEPITVTVETPEGDELTLGLYVQRPQSPLIRLRAKSKRGDEQEYDSRSYLKKHYANGDPVVLEKVGPYRFKIIREGEKPDEKLVQEAKTLQERIVGVNNKLFISVQSNWTDRTELFGYFNQIEGKYNSTPFLRFLQQAADNPMVPHLLILDEMNLSKVEHYFSDFLSCLESRIADGNDIRQEPIYLHGRGDYVEADDPLVEQVPSKLYLPYNLYVTGTVNVDETTYMFSPKVLDRANVIEFNDVDLGLLEGNDAADDTTLVLSTMPSFNGSTPVSVKDYLEAPDSVKAMLRDLIELLKPYSLHFGYRVAEEVSRFVNSVRKHVSDDELAIEAALDAQLVQKVLPKFSGSEAQLEEPLRKVLFRLVQGQKDLDIVAPEQITQVWLEQNSSALADSRFPLATDKIRRMLTDLNQRGFTSFIG
jgi:hypothetical protein